MCLALSWTLFSIKKFSTYPFSDVLWYRFSLSLTASFEKILRSVLTAANSGTYFLAWVTKSTQNYFRYVAFSSPTTLFVRSLRIFSLYNPAFVAFDINLFDFDGNEERAIFNFLLFIQPEELSNECSDFFVELKFFQATLEKVSKLIFSSFAYLFLKFLILVTIFRKLSRIYLYITSKFSLYSPK